GDLRDRRVDVAHQGGPAACGVLAAGDADVEHDRTGLDVLGADQVRGTCGGDDHVRAAQLGGQIGGAGVAQGDGRVVLAPGEQRADGAAHGDAAADDHDVLAAEVESVALGQLDHGARRAGQRGVDGLVGVEHQTAQVHRVQPVGVLGGIDPLEDRIGV